MSAPPPSPQRPSPDPHRSQLPDPQLQTPPDPRTPETWAPVPIGDVDVAAAATAAHGRSLAPDLARGLMLLLIALANVPWWLYATAHAQTNAHGVGFQGADLGYQLVSLVAIDGRAYPLFAFLFGYGIWQLYSRQSAAGTPWRDARALLQRRHAWMIAIGAVHALLLWFGDIVGAYGLVGVIVAWLLLRRSDRVLRITAIVLTALLALGGVLGLASALVLSSAGGDYSAFAGGEMPSVASIDHYGAFMLSSLGIWVVATAGQVLVPTVPLAVLLGILAARRGLLDRPHEHTRQLWRIAIGGIALGWAGGALAAMQFAGLLFPEEFAWATMGLSSLAGVAGGIGYAALFGLVAAALRDRRGPITRSIAALGKRSLSGYLAQSVLFAPLFAAWGFGLGETVTPLVAAGIATGVWLVTVLLAAVLDALGKRGPAEVLLRRLAYGRRRLAAPTPVA